MSMLLRQHLKIDETGPTEKFYMLTFDIITFLPILNVFFFIILMLAMNQAIHVGSVHYCKPQICFSLRVFFFNVATLHSYRLSFQVGMYDMDRF